MKEIQASVSRATSSQACNDLARIEKDLCARQGALENDLEFVTKAWLRDVKRRRPKVEDGDGDGDGNVGGAPLAMVSVVFRTQYRIQEYLRARRIAYP